MNSFDQFNNAEKKKAKEINLKELFLVVKRRFWVIAVVTILAGIVGVLLSQTRTIPLYQSSSRIIIGADEESRKTLQVIIRDSVILDKVIKELELNRTAEALAGQISVGSVDGSQVVSISVIDPDPIFAAKLADTTAKVFRDEVPNIIGQDYIRLLSGAKVSPVAINQGNNNKLFIAVAGGLIIGIGLAFLLESLDDRIRSVREIELLLGVPVLGRVSKVSKRSVKRKTNTMQLEYNLRGENIGNK
ncbi:capsular biosynthesis protein [Neobacillus sp. MM2021_6]|uniref:YveK family protein n=1 Tax=Bacillaceae TaxID=186817 RepID=UPI00140A35EB|nr:MULTISPECIES: Wzz/FepE/Etk N-terminal domain-containing protein [Bacillaceae]MBO0958861.1 capsular biosynthesis protein [Neobacillus sp. MM2021_6]NHC17590.1 capsular biosynthesis protein [Bacillus sp. MM2020_4]